MEYGGQQSAICGLAPTTIHNQSWRSAVIAPPLDVDICAERRTRAEWHVNEKKEMTTK